MQIYKILRGPEWDELQANGATRGAPIDVADGYVHFSTAAQVTETAAKHFAGEEGLWLLTLESEELSPLEWEPSRGGQLFPHLYGPLRLDDVKEAVPLTLEGGSHRFPPLA
ncbi:DUF952 domain-containing protein [Pseudoroseicyclus tamaricis]|uniref:DUF952 domain-containing protein n=1 Tax=Pseudoroseicyclus tamaricis TaxID=2705421 RepID=A0A6B2K3H4_9RHOB|nr:DUF952 domain-containing protein [Pseudoroseicyclus tamaricis]NDV02352.1 DUF952 domain-containing protein [Pseudoroseicyclus tamaricis]